MLLASEVSSADALQARIRALCASGRAELVQEVQGGHGDQAQGGQKNKQEEAIHMSIDNTCRLFVGYIIAIQTT